MLKLAEAQRSIFVPPPSTPSLPGTILFTLIKCGASVHPGALFSAGTARGGSDGVTWPPNHRLVA